MRKLLVYTCAAFLAGMLGCAHDGRAILAEQELLQTPREALIADIVELFEDSRIAHVHWGILIKSLETGEVWYERNADRMFLPASNQKVPTTAAALNFLGPDFRIETHLCHSGEIENGVLDGDLIVFGNGDPTIYSRFYSEPLEVFRGWADDLKSRGITRITGNVIGDDDAWEDRHTGSGWPHDALTPWYYAEFGPLTFNENYVDIMIHPPDTVDGDVILKPNVESSYYTLVNNIRVVEEGSNSIRMYRPASSNTIEMSGTVVAGADPFERTPTITNPTLWYVWVLKETLENEGIQVDGDPVDCDDIEGWSHEPADFTTILVHESPPLADIANGLMKRSQNMYAETMIYTMGWKDTGRGTFFSGRRVIQRELEKFGIEAGSFNYSDGSGLSRHNYISPRQLGIIYRDMLAGSNGEYWWEAQAIMGVDGTLRSRLRDTPAQGNMRGKTGTIGAVRCLSGYLTTARGERLFVSFLANGHLLSSGAIDGYVNDAVLKLVEYDDL